MRAESSDSSHQHCPTHIITSKHMHPAPSDTHEHGSLILDPAGRIIYCCAAAASRAGLSVAQATGRQVRSLLPDIPIRENTPGYNIAVSVLIFGERWQPLRLAVASGLILPVEASMHYQVADRLHSLLLHLRWHRPTAPQDLRFGHSIGPSEPLLRHRWRET